MNDNINYFEDITQVVKYWNELLEKEKFIDINSFFINNTLSLPIDQKYNLNHTSNNIIKSENLVYIKKNNNLKTLTTYLQEIDNKYIIILKNNNCLIEYCEKLTKNAEIFYLIKNNENIGLLAFYANNLDSKRAYISSISIFSEYIGYGLGRQFLKFLEYYLEKIDFKEIELEVDKGNKNAIGFYEKFGFIQYSEKSNTLIMRKTIN